MHSHTFVAAIAIQVLAARVFRLHAVVSTERWISSGNTTTEHWREHREAGARTTHDDLRELLAELRAAVERTRPEFDDNARRERLART